MKVFVYKKRGADLVGCITGVVSAEYDEKHKKLSIKAKNDGMCAEYTFDIKTYKVTLYQN